MRRWSAGRLVASVVLLLAALGLAACDSSGSGGGVDTVSGSVSGLAKGESLVLELNGGGTLTVSSSGTFTFPNGVGTTGNYSVSIASQPRGQVCTVANGAGAGVTSNVTNVAVTCAAQTFTVGGTLTGLDAGSQLVLENHGADALTLTADGSFSLSTKVAFDGTYAVTVATQPADAICTVQHGTGAGVTGDVTSIAVTCSPNTFTLSGTSSGLTSGMQVTLENNSADALTLSANGKFTFSTPLAYLGAYNVGVSTQPVGQTCSVTNGQGSQVTRNVSNITVSCSTNTYTIGGSVSGLGTGQQVTLENNGGDALTVTGNGPFVFTTSLTYGSAYTVTVGTQPAGATCVVSSGAGSPVTADVTGVSVNCVANTVSFTTPGPYTWTVPPGITSVSVVATGGGGGGAGLAGTGPGGAGGAGAVVTSTLSVTPGQVLNLVVGGGGQAGTNGTVVNSGACGAGGGGGGSTNIDAGSSDQIIAGGGGAGGGCNTAGAGGIAGGTGGAGGNGGGLGGSAGGGGGSGGIGGAAGPGGVSGSNGNGGPGGTGGSNGGTLIPGGSGGSGVGSGAGASNPLGSAVNGGGGGGYGGGGGGGVLTGGGAGGSTGPAGTTYAPASNAGGSATNGGDGSIVITLQ